MKSKKKIDYHGQKKKSHYCYPGDKLIKSRTRKKNVTWIDVWYEIKMFQVEQSKMDEKRLEQEREREREINSPMAIMNGK